jgi:outer membrane lipoprotein SlyB
MNNLTTRTLTTTVASVALLAFLTACGSPPRQERTVYNQPAVVVPDGVEYGRINNIEVVRQEARTSGGGAVIGAIIGGVVGNQIGGGTGKALATGAGVVGGAVVGNEVEKRNKREDEVFRVVVRFDNGSTRHFDYNNVDGLRIGDRVKLEGKQLYRV